MLPVRAAAGTHTLRMVGGMRGEATTTGEGSAYSLLINIVGGRGENHVVVVVVVVHHIYLYLYPYQSEPLTHLSPLCQTVSALQAAAVNITGRKYVIPSQS